MIREITERINKRVEIERDEKKRWEEKKKERYKREGRKRHQERIKEKRKEKSQFDTSIQMFVIIRNKLPNTIPALTVTFFTNPCLH